MHEGCTKDTKSFPVRLGEDMRKLKFAVKLDGVPGSQVKQEETRARRLAKMMDVLKNGKKWTG
jgi:hypothetical protein